MVLLGGCIHSDQFVPMDAALKEARIQFVKAPLVRDVQIAVDALDAGSVEPRAMITDTISLHQLPKQLESVRKAHEQCKVLVNPWS